jgi:ABC-type branched-subunit amino acid transport system substrate-binding protein
MEREMANKGSVGWKSAFAAISLVSALLSLTSHVTAAELKFGISGAISGPTRPLGRAMKLGVEVCFHRINQDGGINGNTLSLVMLDDGYVPEIAAANMQRLIEEEQVLALVGNVGTPTAELTVPIANQSRTLLLGALTGANLLRNTPPDRYVINYRASYAEETAAMVAGLLEIGVRPAEIAFFTQDDSYGEDGYEGAIAALEEVGFSEARELPHGRYRRNTLDVDDGLLTILQADIEPRAIIMVGTYGPCAKLIKLAREVLLSTLYLNVSFVSSESLVRDLGANDEDVIVTQVVPYYEADLPLCQEYRRDLKLYDAGASPDFVSLEGYIVARLLVEGLRRSGASPTRESIIDAIEGLSDIDLGLGAPLRFSRADHQASHEVWPTVIRNGRFVEMEWSDLKPGFLGSAQK